MPNVMMSAQQSALPVLPVSEMMLCIPNVVHLVHLHGPVQQITLQPMDNAEVKVMLV
jgi:hypothetical protein